MTARLVQTHSTYITGLMKVLSKFELSTKIKTIIPGHITSTNGSLRSGLELRLTTVSHRGQVKEPDPPMDLVPSIGGSTTQKMIARHLNSVQEVFIVYEAGEFVDSDGLADHMRDLTKKLKPQPSIEVQKKKEEEVRGPVDVKKKSKQPIVRKSKLENKMKAKSGFEWMA